MSNLDRGEHIDAPATDTIGRKQRESQTRLDGAVLRARAFQYARRGDLEIAEPVGPACGATRVQLQVIRLRSGAHWQEASTILEENVVLVFEGDGRGSVADTTRAVERASAMYAPTGASTSITAGAKGAIVYVWRSKLLSGRRRSAAPKLFGSLWDSDTQLQGFMGTGEIEAASSPATMNFVFWPGTGCSQLCLHCGIQQPGETFNVHVHPESDEAFIAFEGVGQVFLRDRWIDVVAGDVLYAAPGVPHGARNPHRGPDARRFVTCGGPTPYDPVLYARAGVTTEVQ
jgi:glyoxylate utilization-related uncharacterized protein